ncbi:MAG: hypothetical protein RIS76_1591 [Verrucomicrobiota bacterium]
MNDNCGKISRDEQENPTDGTKRFGEAARHRTLRVKSQTASAKDSIGNSPPNTGAEEETQCTSWMVKP